MCGIFAFWAREGSCHPDIISHLIGMTVSRGEDGFGIWVDGKTHKSDEHRCPYRLCYNKKGSLLMCCSRATPETENITRESDIQPIITDDLILIHNGGVTDSMAKEFPLESRTSTLDSELILAAYRKHSGNLKAAMENLSGSFAFVLFDREKNRLYACCSFNPLAHMYVRGIGYFIHSDVNALKEALTMINGISRNVVNVWEDWYYHDIPGYTIVETDLDSGMQRIEEFNPRFLHPTFDRNDPPKEDPMTYVIASGGIDSGLTAWTLQKAGHNVSLVHFMYGQKAQAAEEWAVDRIAERMDVTAHKFDLRDIYKYFVDSSMLLQDLIKVDSGGENIKSTIAWVSGRNAIFASIVLGLAEARILSNYYTSVNIAAGWAQLSEETGGYPDNSYKFVKAIEELKKFGYIAGDRIKILSVMQRITKTEEWILGDALRFPFELTVSCDCPSVTPYLRAEEKWAVEYRPSLCIECGSTKLSIIAADRAGVHDPRLFTSPRPTLSPVMSTASPKQIIQRLMLTDEEKEILCQKINQKW